MPGELPGERMALVPIDTPPEALIVPVPEIVPCVIVSGRVNAVEEFQRKSAPEPLTTTRAVFERLPALLTRNRPALIAVVPE